MMEQELEEQLRQVKIGYEIKKLFVSDAKISSESSNTVQ
jgi:hypothetical protein